jgi:hypothetical protein
MPIILRAFVEILETKKTRVHLAAPTRSFLLLFFFLPAALTISPVTTSRSAWSNMKLKVNGSRSSSFSVSRG